jgi:hypothetical protein
MTTLSLVGACVAHLSSPPAHFDYSVNPTDRVLWGRYRPMLQGLQGREAVRRHVHCQDGRVPCRVRVRVLCVGSRSVSKRALSAEGHVWA